MENLIDIDDKLVAPCGMFCGVCSSYLSCVNDLKRSKCAGCRTTDKQCDYLFEKCSGINHGIKGTSDAPFCYECEQFPCKEIKRMDKRYRENYGISVISNLEAIRDKGLSQFIADQKEEHQCSSCKEMKSVHNGRCFRCETITKLVDKENRLRQQ